MKNRVRHGAPESKREWQGTIEQWRQSGQTVRNYCRAQGLKESAFYFWRRELTRRDDNRSRRWQPAGKTPKRGGASTPAHPHRRAVPKPLPADEAHFLPVRTVSPAVDEKCNGLEIALADGRVLRLRPDFVRQTLSDV